MIQTCNCGDYRSPAADYQNKTYGFGMRVHNPAAKEMATCTVCGEKRPRAKPPRAQT